MKKTYRITGLDCANCAAKLEVALKEVDGFQDVRLNFMTSRLMIDSDREDINQAIEEVVKRVEPGVTFSELSKPTVNTRKIFILEGLNCAHCASKIEQHVSQLEGVEDCSLNFVKKTLTLQSNRSDLQATLQALCDRIEPGIHVVTLRQLKSRQGTSQLKARQHHSYIYVIEGLDCANCALKVERYLGSKPMIEKAQINFMQKKLYLTTMSSLSLNEVQAIVDEVEDGVKISTLNAPKHDSKKPSKKINKQWLPQVILFVGLFICVFLPESCRVLGWVTIYLGVGFNVLKTALSNIRRGDIFDENFLMAIATIGALIIGEYPEAIAVMVFYEIGEYFQGRAIDSSRRSIEDLMNIRPDKARIKRGDGYLEVKPEEVSVGDLIEIRAGERVPIDGVIVQGNSVVDTFSMTGESVGRQVRVGDPLVSGFVNKSGTLVCKVTSAYGDSAVSRILDLVENATNKKAKTEKMITRFARVYTPVVVVLGLLIAFVSPLFFDISLKDSVYKGMVFLVVSCPCALVLSVPLGYFAGIGRASKDGILIKGSNYLETLQKVDTIVFDKTGTLTEGQFKVLEVKENHPQLLEYVAYAEAKSHHPIAMSIVEAYGKPIDQGRIGDVEEIAGKGIKALVDGHVVHVGNKRLMDDLHLAYDEVSTYGSVVYVAVDYVYSGYIVVGDQLKSNSVAMVKQLKAMGKKVVMLSGDVKQTALKIAAECGIDDVRYELLPDQKVTTLETLGEHVAFVGDGINDAPVLARSSVGISMGGLGSDAAIEASDVVLMDDDLMKIIDSIQIANTTKKIIYQNIIFSLGVKILVMVLSVFGIASMWLGVFADVGVTLIAVINSLRILKKHYKNTEA